ncbi:MAG: Tad domain-containing protein [Clostridia bacterium]|nr:Tad domain-containing protein [Clostridia bacterium]
MKTITILKNNRGSSIVFFTIILTVILGFAALTIDFGVIAYEKFRLTSSVDAASLAGAQELVANTGYTKEVAESYIYKNIQNVKNVVVSVDSSSRMLQVSSEKTVDNYFAKIFGKNSQDISAVSKARVENIKSLKGARPLAIVQQTFTYGKMYTLKEGGGDGTTGNYAAIALGGTGGSIYRNNLLNGYSGTITVNDVIPTETGNIAGTTVTSINELLGNCNHIPACTYQSYNKYCSKIIFLPVVNTLTVNGRKHIKVLGFATFFLEGVTSMGGQADVIGRFITYCMEGETSTTINDYGTYGIRLIK